MSRINGDKARSNRQKRKRDVQRMKDRASRAASAQKSPGPKSPKARRPVAINS